MDRDNLKNLDVAVIGSGGLTGKALINFLINKVNSISLFDDKEWSQLPEILSIKAENPEKVFFRRR